jgi:hypothetical protein
MSTLAAQFRLGEAGADDDDGLGGVDERLDSGQSRITS